MRYVELTGDMYSIPNKTDIHISPEYYLIHTPGISIVFGENEYSESIFSLPPHRVDEADEIVNNGEIVQKNKTINVFIIDKYINIMEKVENPDNIHSRSTYLYDDTENKIVFKILSHHTKNRFKDTSVKNNKVILKTLRNGETVLNKEQIDKYVDEGYVSRLTALDKESRGLYKNTVKDPYWNEK